MNQRVGVLIMGFAVSLAACEETASTPGAPPAGSAKPATTASGAASATASAATSAAAPAVSPEVMARGKLVADMAGCALCHTQLGPEGPVMDKMWAGGLEIPEVFGTWRSPNITQDKKTGIGGWTDEQILAAVREGKRPDGSKLYPIMPYPFYNVMSDDDAKALVAYLRTIKPIENAVEGNTDLKLPKMDVPPAKGEKPADDPIKQGEYYASLMHCAACHTPMTEQGPDMTKMFAGGMPIELPMLGEGKIFTANLTSDEATGLGKWTDEEIGTAIRGKKRDGSPVLPPMALYSPVWSKLPDEQVNALVKFVRTIPAIDNKVPASTFKPKAPPPGDAPKDAPPSDAPSK